MILRSIVAIRAIGGLICHSSVERFPSKDDPKKADAMFHYRGFIFAFGSRLFMIDFESDQRNEMTAAILAPRIRTGSTLLFGLTMGVAASVAREPFATRVAFKRISEKRLRPENLRRATALKPGDASIPNDIASYLGADKRILRAVDGALRTALKEMADETVGP